MGDSKLVINWVNGLISMENLKLIPLFEHVKLMNHTFDLIYFYYIYAENFKEDDSMSKQALIVEEISWEILEK